MGHDNVYDGLLEAENDARWAYGTGFDDPLDGVDTTLEVGVDRVALTNLCIELGDDALIMSQSLQRWVSRLPELEEETAVANMALDLLGQARLLLARGGLAEGGGRTEDNLAYGRTASEFRNVTLAELPDSDFAALIARLLVFSAWRVGVLTRLLQYDDGVLRAVAGKALKELSYHQDYAIHWTLRLGDGTAVSHERMQRALDDVWPYLGGLDVAEGHPVLKSEVRTQLESVIDAATLVVPVSAPSRGHRGEHGEDFLEMIRDMHSVADALPGGVW